VLAKRKYSRPVSKTHQNYKQKPKRSKPKSQSFHVGAELVDEQEVTWKGEREYRDRPWKARKLRAEAVSMAYLMGDPDLRNIGERMKECASYLSFGLWQQSNSEFGLKYNKRLLSSNFCKARLCPQCQARRSIRLFQQLDSIVSVYKERYPSHRGLMLTLTIPNVPEDQLSEGVDRILAGFRKMTNSRKWKGFAKAAFRSLEVSYNPKTETFHPHLHVLLMVDKNYFTRDRGKYLTQEDWQSWWSECMDAPPGQEYIIEVHTVKRRKGQSAKGALAEVTKYAVKPEDVYWLKENGSYAASSEIIMALHYALRGRHLVMFYGEFRVIKKELKLEDVDGEDVDLVAAQGYERGADHPELGAWIGELFYRFSYGATISDTDYRLTHIERGEDAA